MSPGGVHGLELSWETSAESEVPVVVKQFHPVFGDLEATPISGELFGEEVSSYI